MLNSVQKTVVYFGLGSNQENALGKPIWHIQQAIKALSALGETSADTLCSSLYKSIPMGPQDQPDYLNAVVGVCMSKKMLQELPPEKLLDFTQGIEKASGREKKRHWGERSIDVDILLYAHQQYQSDRLCIPHVGILQRNFVAVPLLEIAPDICLKDKALADMPIAHDMSGLEKLTDIIY